MIDNQREIGCVSCEIRSRSRKRTTAARSVRSPQLWISLLLVSKADGFPISSLRTSDAGHQKWQKPNRVNIQANSHYLFRKRPSSSSIAIRQPRQPSYSTALHGISPTFSAVLLPGEAVVAGWSMALLALQFAFQPLLTKSYATNDVIRTTYVVAQDVIRFVVCACLLTMTVGWSDIWGHWTLASSLIAAGVPALLYALQNYCSLMAYQHLSPISYNVLNQTKTLSAAFFCYFLLGKPQSKMQVLSLVVLLGAALVMEKVVPIRRQLPTTGIDTYTNLSIKDEKKEDDAATTTGYITKGIVPVLLASLTSGLAGTLCQQTLQVVERNLLLFSMEISAFSSLVLMASLIAGNPDSKKIFKGDFTQGWTKRTWIPIFTNAMGGVLVALVTKYAGSVRKGFALVVGLLLSGVLQNGHRNESKVSLEQWVGGFLAAMSIWMHVLFPISLPR